MALYRLFGKTLSASLVLRALGALMLVMGIGSLALGPLEMVCFNWFEEGGRFAYDGFGFGSFMFGNMVVQILGYYLVAAVLIPLGFGHLRLRRWVLTVIPALVWCWVVLGVPLLVVVLFILLATKELTAGVAVAVASFAALSYVALPALVIGLYRSRRVQTAFGALGRHSDPFSDRVETLGVRLLVVIGLEAFTLLALHTLLLFNGIFPIPSGWATGLSGYVRVDIAILCLLAVGSGTVRRRRWAWWASLLCFSLLIFLWVGTLASTSWLELLAALAFPPYELAFLDGIPAQGWHLAAFVGLPLAGTWVAILRAYAGWGAQ